MKIFSALGIIFVIAKLNSCKRLKNGESHAKNFSGPLIQIRYLPFVLNFFPARGASVGADRVYTKKTREMVRHKKNVCRSVVCTKSVAFD